eukprot:5971521-Pyramimonas_sp.AAC.1
MPPGSIQSQWAAGALTPARVHKPEPSAPAAATPPILPTHTYYRDLFLRFLSRCTRVEQLDLLAWFQHEKGNHIRFATACSGTDCVALVWQGFVDAVNMAFSAAIAVDHAFSCENSAKKRDFIMQWFRPPILFDDAIKLGNSTCHDTVAAGSKTVPHDVSNLIAGWPCTDASPNNIDASTERNRSCVAEGTLRTGAVFGGI